MANGVIIHQQIKSSPIEGLFLVTSIVDAETGEIHSQEFLIKNSFFLDSIVESVLDDVIKKAESMDKEVVAIDSPFLDYIILRKELLNG